MAHADDLVCLVNVEMKKVFKKNEPRKLEFDDEWKRLSRYPLQIQLVPAAP